MGKKKKETITVEWLEDFCNFCCKGLMYCINLRKVEPEEAAVAVSLLEILVAAAKKEAKKNE